MTDKSIRVLFILDYLKVHYIREKRNNPDSFEDVFFNSKEGKLLRSTFEKELENSGFKGNINYYTDYAYNLIPTIIHENEKHPERNKYKTPTLTQARPKFEELKKRIVNLNPDIVVPLGGLVTKALLGQNKITSLRGKPESIEIDDKNFWLLPMLSPSYVMVNPNNTRFLEVDTRLLARFISDGEKAFEPHKVSYEVIEVGNISRVIEVFNEAFKHGKTPYDPIAWDYETNSFHAEYDGAKLLSISLSWGAHTGVTIPIDHPYATWNKEDYNVLIKLLKAFLSSSLWKVGHNIQFDERQSKLIIDRDITFVNTLDTLVAFYIAVSQDVSESFGLKTLAYQYTDMGGYEAPLDEYVNWFSKGTKHTLVKELFNVRKGKREPLTEEDYLPWMTEDEREYATNTANKLLDKYEHYNAIVNPIDGSKFSYAWIPYSILGRYAGGDVDVTRRIHDAIYKNNIVANSDWNRLYTEHYPQLLDTLADIEVNGIKIDIERLEGMRDAFEEEQERLVDSMRSNSIVKEIEEQKTEYYNEWLKQAALKPAERDTEIYKAYIKYRKPEDRLFKPTSAADVKLALYGKIGYTFPIEKDFITDKAFKAVRSGEISEDDVTYLDYKTDKKAIEKLLEDNPDFTLANDIIRYKKLEKLQTTYTDGIINLSDSNSVLHGHFNATKTATTRLASKDPNLQNIPRAVNDPSKVDYKYQIKDAFTPHYDKGQDVILNLDYSSQEAHLAAVLAHDDDMIEAFLEGKDVHKQTASLAFGVPEEEVTKDLRTKAKQVTFG